MSIIAKIIEILVWIVLFAVAVTLVYFFIVFMAIIFTVLVAMFYMLFVSAGDVLFNLDDLFREITRGA